MMPTDRHPSPGAPDDPLLRRYHEANALDVARPPAALRDAVLTQARTAVAQAARPAANDSRWAWRALGSVAVLGLVGLLVLQFESGTDEERALALGTSPAARSTSPSAAAVPTLPPAAGDAQRQPAAPVPSLANPSPANVLQERARPDNATVARSGGAPTGAARERAAAPVTSPRRDAEFPAQLPPAPAETTQNAPVPAGQVRPAPPLVAATEPADRTSEPERRARVGAAPAVAAKAADSAVSAPAAQATAPAPPPAAMFRGTAEAPEAGRTEPAAAESVGRSAAGRLLAAAGRGDAAAVRDALANGADVNAPDAAGRTPLMLAAERGHPAVVRVLLAGGADAQRADRQGFTAADLARRAGQQAVLQLLETPAVR